MYLKNYSFIICTKLNKHRRKCLRNNLTRTIISSFDVILSRTNTCKAERFMPPSGVILIPRVALHRASVVDFSCQLHDRPTDLLADNFHGRQNAPEEGRGKFIEPDPLLSWPELDARSHLVKVPVSAPYHRELNLERFPRGWILKRQGSEEER